MISYPVMSHDVIKQTWDFLEWISMTSIPTLLNSDAMYPVKITMMLVMMVMIMRTSEGTNEWNKMHIPYAQDT